MGSSWNEVGAAGSLRQGPQPGGAPLDDMPLVNSFEPCPDMALGSLRQGSHNGDRFSFTKGRGAGRTFEAVFPVPSMYVTGNGTGIDAISRYGVVNTVQSTLGQAPATQGVELYKGRAAIKFHAPAGQTALNGPAFTLPFLKGGAKHKGDYSCWRVKAILAAAPAGTGDLGLMVMTDGGRPLFDGSAAGMGLRPHADNTVTFAARPSVSLGFPIEEECQITLDVTEYNCYEFRFIGATNDQDAFLRVMINGIVQFEFTYGELLLPMGSLEVAIASRGGGDLWLPICGALVAGAYDEGSLL